MTCSAVAALVAGPAAAATITLVDDGTVAGSKADEPFRIAADFWGNILTNDTCITIAIGFERIPGLSVGVTTGRYATFSVRAWEKAVARTRSRSVIDTVALPPPLTHGAITGLTLGLDAAGRNDVGNPAPLRHRQRAARLLLLNSAVAKATGLPLDHPEQVDATITLNSAFAFDVDPTDGVARSGVDLVAVAIHEMGHALGFGSGVADLDAMAAPAGHGDGSTGDFNDQPRFNALDMFRYGAPGRLDLRPGTETYFSIDGGRTALLGVRFASGSANGDGDEADHFKQTVGHCTMSFGTMDAARCGGQMGIVTAADLAAFDAIGWNLSVDALHFANLSTADIVRRYRIRQSANQSTGMATGAGINQQATGETGSPVRSGVDDGLP